MERTHPPFEVGNDVAKRHGAYMEALIAPLAAEKVAGLLALAAAPDSSVSYLADPSYAPAVMAWARVEARCDRVEAWLVERVNGEQLTDDGEIRPAAKLLDRLESQADRLRARLGLDPLSRARLGRDIAAGSVDMATLLARLDDSGDD